MGATIERLKGLAKALGAVRAAFLASLLLSLVAVQGSLINRDGIIYVDAARAIVEQGLFAPRQGIDWQFLPILIAGAVSLTGLSAETAAHVLDALLLAGACALLVAMTRRRLPEAAWAACLVALAMPAYNQYRSEILREYGFWFFCLLAFWLAMRWDETRRSRDAVACQLALAAATLFRLEAVVFYPALMLWQAFAAPAGQKLRRMLAIGALPLAGGLAAALAFGAGLLPVPQRVLYYLEAASPLRKLQTLNEAAARMSETVFKYKYSREEAGYILLFGLLSVIPVKFLKMSGVLLVPLACALPGRAALARWQPLPWAFLGYFLVLAAFVTHQFFLVGRYVSLLNLLAVPLVAAGLARLMQRHPRWGAPILALTLATMAANVVSFSPRKTHVVEAGRWLGAHAGDAARVGVDNARLAYYAGWRQSQAASMERPALAQALAEGRLDMVAVEMRQKDADAEKWLAENRLKLLRRFANEAGDAVAIAVPEDQASPSMTGRSRPNTASTE